MGTQVETHCRQRGYAVAAILVVLLLAAAAASYFYANYKPASNFHYVNAEATELHGNVYWEQSNIPAKDISIALYAQNGANEKVLNEQLVADDGYYRIRNIDINHPLVIKVFRQDSKGNKQELLTSGPIMLTEGRSKYLPLYLTSQAERRAGGYQDRLEGKIVTSGRKIFISPGEGLSVQLEGGHLAELRQFTHYRVVVKGAYRSQHRFIVASYHVMEIDNGERPLMGVLRYKTINGSKRFVLQGEQAQQLLYVPANYRLRTTMLANIGKKVLLTGPEENGGIKPLTFEVVKN